MDLLAERLRMDPADLRRKNAIRTGDLTPTGAPMDESTGDLPACLAKVRERLDWDTQPHPASSCPTAKSAPRASPLLLGRRRPSQPSPTPARCSISPKTAAPLSTGVIEIDQGARWPSAMLVAEALKTDLAHVHVTRHVDTDRSPRLGHRREEPLALHGRPRRASAGRCRRPDPEHRRRAASVAPRRTSTSPAAAYSSAPVPTARCLPLEKVVLGYVYPNGNAGGGPVIGRGWYITPDLTALDPNRRGQAVA